MAGLGRTQEVSSSCGPIPDACTACLEITMAGSCSGPSACSHHHLPLPFSTSLPYIKVSSLSLSPSHSRSHAGVDHSRFLVSQCPQIILPGGSISCRPVAQHCHCPQLLCPTELPLPSGGRAISQHCHPSAIPILFPLDFWQSGANLDCRFPSLSSCRLPFSSHWKRHCKYILLHCLVFYSI